MNKALSTFNTNSPIHLLGANTGVFALIQDLLISLGPKFSSQLITSAKYYHSGYKLRVKDLSVAYILIEYFLLHLSIEENIQLILTIYSIS